MRKALFIFVLLALIAPFAAADVTPSQTLAVAEAPVIDAPSAEAPEAAPEVDLDALFEELGEGQPAEARSACPHNAPGECTYTSQCMLFQDPDDCPGGDWVCVNPSGQTCNGDCVCC